MKEYLSETKSIDYMDPHIQQKVNELSSQSTDDADYIKKAFLFVRDEIPHSWDIQTNTVSRTASDVIINGTGICWTKSCLLAGLLRARGIPSGISYQLLTIAEDDSMGHIIHALNTVYIKDLDKWIRIDARGNQQNQNEEFSPDRDYLAFSPREEYGEIDYHDNNHDLDKKLIKLLNETENLLEMEIDF